PPGRFPGDTHPGDAAPDNQEIEAFVGQLPQHVVPLHDHPLLNTKKPAHNHGVTCHWLARALLVSAPEMMELSRRPGPVARHGPARGPLPSHRHRAFRRILLLFAARAGTPAVPGRAWGRWSFLGRFC